MSEVDDLPKNLEEDCCYHGLLPREDVAELLANIGDYMLRLSQPKPTDPREVIVSVRVTQGNDPLAVRHIIIKRKKVEDVMHWYALEDFSFPSLDDLISYYVSSQQPINPQVLTSVLKTPVKRQLWEFHHKDVKLKEQLGAGAFGEVRAGEVFILGRKYECAVKLAKKVKDEAEFAHAKEKIKEMMHEARLMRHYDHVNVVRMYGVAVDCEPLMIVIELVKGGSILSDLRSRKGTVSHDEKINCMVKGGSILSDLRSRKGTVSHDEKINCMVLGTANGLSYLHSRGCIHRDIAARNVLYTRTKIAKISDFGLSREGCIYRMKGSKKVPIKWTAPETMSTFIYTLKSDVFAFSILVWEVFSDGEEPYGDLSSAETKRKVMAGYRMQPPAGCPEGIPELMKRCWEQDPDERWSMDDAVDFIKYRIAKLSDDDSIGEHDSRDIKASIMIVHFALSTACSIPKSPKIHSRASKSRLRNKKSRDCKTESTKSRSGQSSKVMSKKRKKKKKKVLTHI
uniref:Tyrosine-protein kinase n=1 Tax=Ascaris lumbricoides TaxID=6252 RepID=A0A0M3IIB3_ASCLU